MKKEWADVWADFLEKPELKQAKRTLSQGNDLDSPKCCLGHLEYCLGNRFKENPPDSRKYFNGAPIPKAVRYDIVVQPDGSETSASGGLSPATRKKVGMKSSLGCFETPIDFERVLGIFCKSAFYESILNLAVLNDTGFSLKEIAKVIRDKWEEL